MPECSASGEVVLYRCRSFPDQWEPAACLLRDVRAVDPTPLRLAGSWWMFANVPVLGAAFTDELHLFRAERLEGPWHPVPGNPVKSDVRSARPV